MPVAVSAALLLAIATGVALRVVAPTTTVFCNDQARACALARDIAEGRWETAGLVNSGGFRNLPGYVYLLAAVAAVSPSPAALLYFTVAANLVALALAAYLMWRWVGTSSALWGMAFLAAGPWPIHYCRWIFAQHLLFPSAILVYLALWAWLCRGRPWAAAGVILALALVLHVHLAGVALLLAVVLLVAWRRPRLPTAPLVVGAAVALLSALPYLLAGHIAPPGARSLGFTHIWRVLPAAAMSVTGIGWSLEFRDGYPAFAEMLGWRRWPYEAVMLAPVLLFAWAAISSLAIMRRARRIGRDEPWPAWSLVTALVVLIPLSFALLGIRTSPTYFPLWYPLPFVLIGCQCAKLTHTRRAPASPGQEHMFRTTRIGRTAALLAVLAVELVFFTEQLQYIRRHGGVPESVLDRSYASLRADIASLAAQEPATQVWMVCRTRSSIMDEATAYLFRDTPWPGSAPRRVLIIFDTWRPEQSIREVLTPGAAAPDDAFLVHPWQGPHQRDGRIPRRPAPAGPPHVTSAPVCFVARPGSSAAGPSGGAEPSSRAATSRAIPPDPLVPPAPPAPR